MWRSKTRGGAALFVFVGLALAPQARAGGAAPPVVDVTTAGELLAAIAGAQAGDEIVLADGTYALTGATCAASGTASAPIVVRPATQRGARVELSGVEGFLVTGAHWHFEGLDVHGVCAQDDDCEHAFHVTGAADGFVLRDSRVMDFNAQLKVNASQVGGLWRTPNAGLIEHNELGDTRARATGNPVTKLNIDTGDDWIVRGNFLHDFHKGGGNTVSYGVFLKSGGRRGLLERNLVVCSLDVPATGATLGLSLGGGGTAPQFCAPAFDAGTPCAVEHQDGTIRNNIVANCSDVGIYLNRAANTRVLYNTLVATSGIDFRFDTTTGVAIGNVLGGAIRERDGGTYTGTSNLTGVALGTFAALYRAPLAGDLALLGDPAALLAAGPAELDVTDDYCGRVRGGAPYDLGALEHSLGDCETLPPPGSAGGGGATGTGGTSSGGASSTGGAGGAPSGGAPSGGAPSGGAPSGGAPSGGASSGGASSGAGGEAGYGGSQGTGAALPGGGAASGGESGSSGAEAGASAASGGDEAGCSCRAPRAAGERGGLAAALAGAALIVVRRRRRAAG